MTQQDPTFFNQTRQQPVVPPMYAQQQVQKVSFPMVLPTLYLRLHSRVYMMYHPRPHT